MPAHITRHQPYHTLAQIYDYVMRHVEYDKWAAYIHAILERFEHYPRNLVDLACGTGNIALELRSLGYVVSGVDRSASMLQVGREKSRQAGADIDFLQSDLRRLDDLGETFDAAVCIYDSVNYLLTLTEIQQALDQIHSILSPDGLLIFDVCTEQNSLRYFNAVRDTEEGPGFTYSRHSYYDRTGQLQMNHFRIRFEGREGVWEEIHTQRIYPLKQIIAQIEDSPFDLRGAFSGFTFKSGSERSDRIHFVLHRP